MRRYWKWALLFAYAAMMVSLLGVIVSAAVREINGTEHYEGNSIVEVPGIFTKANVGEVLALVNSYRREACQKGYPNPYDPEVRLTMDDYSEVKWSGDLEWIAQTRAAEGTVLQDHTRPNGKSCFDISYHDTYSASETLAWNYGSLIGGIKQWYEDQIQKAEGQGRSGTRYFPRPALKL